MYRILLVEDDASLGYILKEYPRNTSFSYRTGKRRRGCHTDFQPPAIRCMYPGCHAAKKRWFCSGSGD